MNPAQRADDVPMQRAIDAAAEVMNAACDDEGWESMEALARLAVEAAWPHLRDHNPVLGSGDPASCGHPNPIWFADSRLWNEVMGGDQDEEAGGIVCPSCFADRADAHFEGTRWKILGWRMVPDWGRPERSLRAGDLALDGDESARVISQRRTGPQEHSDGGES